MIMDNNETLEMINTSLQQFGTEFVNAILSNEVLLDTLFNLCQGVKSMSKEERLNVANTVSKLGSQQSQFN
jgi:histidyl-tRNA synthetase